MSLEELCERVSELEGMLARLAQWTTFDTNQHQYTNILAVTSESLTVPPSPYTSPKSSKSPVCMYHPESLDSESVSEPELKVLEFIGPELELDDQDEDLTHDEFHQTDAIAIEISDVKFQPPTSDWEENSQSDSHNVVKHVFLQGENPDLEPVSENTGLFAIASNLETEDFGMQILDVPDETTLAASACDNSHSPSSKVVIVNWENDLMKCPPLKVLVLSGEDSPTNPCVSMERLHSSSSQLNLLAVKVPVKPLLLPQPISHPSTSTENGDRGYQCGHCSTKTENIHQLKKHLRTHASKKVKPSHIRTVHKVGTRFKCPHCSKGLQDNARLIRHMRTHTGEKPFECHSCKTKFSEASNLRKHIRVIHERETRYKCPHCPRGYYNRLDLTSHLRIHTDERPCECPHCPMRFRDSSALNKHRRKEHGAPAPDTRSLKCPQCSLQFKGEIQLENHMRTHSHSRSTVSTEQTI